MNSYNRASSILPAGRTLFKKNKVSISDIALEWPHGSVVVARDLDTGKYIFIAGSQTTSLYFPLGSRQEFRHDQNFSRIGKGDWLIVNQFNFNATTTKWATTPAFDQPTAANLYVFK